MSNRLLVWARRGLFQIERDGAGRWEICRSLWDDPRDPRHIIIAVSVGGVWTRPDTAWFVPATKDEQRVPVDARPVVTRTRDGEQQFDVLDRGLPQGPAYDLLCRHALDCSPDGERLAFGSTTGSLWISEDQGDTWQSVSHHLPPVACVRCQG
jgi:hypothetical protein